MMNGCDYSIYSYLLALLPYVFSVLPGTWLVTAILRWAPVPKNLRSRIEAHLPLSG